jgi:transposase
VVAAAEQQHSVLQEAVQQRDAEIDKLQLLIKRLLRQQFGRRSEQLSPDQLLLGIEDLEQTIAENQAKQDAADPAADKPRPRREARPNRNHGALPAHLPRYEVLIDVERRDCPCCGGTLHVIDEERSEQLDIVPAQLRVRVTRRPRYGCRARLPKVPSAKPMEWQTRAVRAPWWWPPRRSGRSMAAWPPRR